MTTVLYTPRQGQYLAFIAAYIRRYGQPPAEAEVAAHFMVSPPSAHLMVVTLERRGLIERIPGRPRSIRIVLPPEAVPDLKGSPPSRQEQSPSNGKYPHIARWILDGWVELGQTEYSRSMARALDEGGIVWEGKTSYADLDTLLRDLDEGIAQWMAVQFPTSQRQPSG